MPAVGRVSVDDKAVVPQRHLAAEESPPGKETPVVKDTLPDEDGFVEQFAEA